MGYIDRHREIENILRSGHRVLVDDLSQRFQVSEVTIRKDLTELERRGILLRTHGGAVLAEQPELIIPLHQRQLDHVGEKNSIARVAANRIRDGESIVLDTGSTTLALARELHGRNVNIITNSLPIASELIGEEHVNIMVLGGTLRRGSLALINNSLSSQLKPLHVDRAFMGASGFDPATGFSCQNMIEAKTKRAMLEAANEVVVLIDHSKFGQPLFAPFCDLEQAHCVITDAPLPKDATEALRKAGVSIVLAQSFREGR